MIENLNKLVVSSRPNKLARSLVTSMLLLNLLSACSSYKSSWDCPKAKGIGCSSLEYADEMAREQILLNTGKYKTSTQATQVTQDTNKRSQAHQMLLKQDLLGSEEYEIIEIE